GRLSGRTIPRGLYPQRVDAARHARRVAALIPLTRHGPHGSTVSLPVPFGGATASPLHHRPFCRVFRHHTADCLCRDRNPVCGGRPAWSDHGSLPRERAPSHRLSTGFNRGGGDPST